MTDRVLTMCRKAAPSAAIVRARFLLGRVGGNVGSNLREVIEGSTTMEVYISEDAFWGLLVSTIEVYKRECFGFLIGYRDTNNIFIVEHALPSQSVKRWNTGVIENKRSERRIKRFLSNLPPLSLIGDFHSHAGWGDLKGVPIPSDQDVRQMAPNTLYIIIEVNDKRKSVPWNYNDDGTISGTTDEYYFKIVAYYLDSRQRAKRANIFCPYAIGFDAKTRSTNLQFGAARPRSD